MAESPLGEKKKTRKEREGGCKKSSFIAVTLVKRSLGQGEQKV